jgi:hypothetical protein
MMKLLNYLVNTSIEIYLEEAMLVKALLHLSNMFKDVIQAIVVAVITT